MRDCADEGDSKFMVQDRELIQEARMKVRCFRFFFFFSDRGD